MRTSRFAETLRAIAVVALINALFLAALTFFFGSANFPNGTKTVYTTKTGECYHLARCSSLTYSKYKTTLKEAVQDGYRSCSNCNPPILKREDGTVFRSLHYFCVVPLAALCAHAGSVKLLRIDSKRPFLLYLAHLAFSALLSSVFDLLV